MVVITRQPLRASTDAASVAELERLWASSPGAENAAAVASPRPEKRPYRVLVRALAAGWPAVLLAVFAFAPAPSPDVSYPAWVVAASVAILVGPVVAGVVAAKGFGTTALVTSLSLAGLGISVGVACRATAHHTGGWWIGETAAFALLAGLSLTCLVARRS